MDAQTTGIFTTLAGDSNFWVLVASILFVAVVYFKGAKPICDFLDARSAKIRADLDEASRLKEEAQAMLADIQKKHRDAMQTADEIVENARQTALRLQAETEKKLEDSLARREAQLLDRIGRAESAAVADVRQQAADIAAKAAEVLLQDTLAKRGGKLVDDAIADLSKTA